jgi:excisionase family DNA binding protein
METEIEKLIYSTIRKAFEDWYGAQGNENVESDSGYMNITQAAKYLKRSRPTLYSYVKDGRIPFFRMKNSRGIYFKIQDLNNLYSEVKFKYQ